MTLPPPPGPPEPTGLLDPFDSGGPIDPDADLLEVTAALERGGPRRLAAVIRALRGTIVLLCLAAAGTGLGVILFGAVAWRDQPTGLLFAALVGVPAVALPLYVAWRSSMLAEAIADPAEVASQAKDLAVHLKGSVELHRLAGRLRARDAVAAGRAVRGSTRGAGRLRRMVRSGRSLSALIGLAQPDPVRHRLLIPFTPVRMRALWLAITVGLWWWLAAAIVATIAGFAAAASLL